MAKKDDSIFTSEHQSIYEDWCSGSKSFDELVGCYDPICNQGTEPWEVESGLSPPLAKWLRKKGVQDADIPEVLNEVFCKLAKAKRHDSSLKLVVTIAKSAKDAYFRGESICEAKGEYPARFNGRFTKYKDVQVEQLDEEAAYELDREDFSDLTAFYVSETIRFDALTIAIERLDQELRDVVVLRYFSHPPSAEPKQLSNQQVAHRLDISTKTVERRLEDAVGGTKDVAAEDSVLFVAWREMLQQRFEWYIKPSSRIAVDSEALQAFLDKSADQRKQIDDRINERLANDRNRLLWTAVYEQQQLLKLHDSFAQFPTIQKLLGQLLELGERNIAQFRQRLANPKFHECRLTDTESAVVARSAPFLFDSEVEFGRRLLQHDLTAIVDLWRLAEIIGAGSVLHDMLVGAKAPTSMARNRYAQQRKKARAKQVAGCGDSGPLKNHDSSRCGCDDRPDELCQRCFVTCRIIGSYCEDCINGITPQDFQDIEGWKRQLPVWFRMGNVSPPRPVPVSYEEDDEPRLTKKRKRQSRKRAWYHVAATGKKFFLAVSATGWVWYDENNQPHSLERLGEHDQLKAA